MSHLKERKEKQCLNCNAITYGRFCQVCGQENVEPKETFLHLLRHFIEDITHFDGKFFDTLKYLLLRPGFLAYEYMRGRRNSYLNPIRMYIFTSAIFFLIYFSVNKNEAHSNTIKQHSVKEVGGVKGSITTDIKKGIQEGISKTYPVNDSLSHIVNVLSDSLSKTTDSVKREKLTKDIRVIKRLQKISNKISGKNEDDIDENDTSKAQLTKSKLKENDESWGNEFIKKIFPSKEEFQHKIPQVMFVTLPLMALILQLLYGRLKYFFYVNHIIFIINLYIGVYLIILLEMGFSYLDKISHVGLFGFVASILSLGTFFYTYKSLRNFYLQGRVKTIIKCLLLFTLFFIIAVLSYILVAAIPLSVSH